MICRLCLNRMNTDCPIDIFDEQEEFEIGKPLVHLIAQYLNLKLIKEDAISTKICAFCYGHLDDFVSFVEIVQQKQSTLKEDLINDYGTLAPTNYEENAETIEIEILPTLNRDIDISRDGLENADIATTDSCESVNNSSSEISEEKAAEPYTKRNPKQHDQIIANYMELNCSICKEYAENFCMLTKHYHGVHNKPPVVVCCQLKFHNAQNLAEHIKQHQSADSIICAYCQQQFDNAELLEAHKTVAHVTPSEQQKEQLKCHHCNKQFQVHRRLERHILKHESRNQIAFVCHICDKIYRVKKCLENHIRKHGDEKRTYACDICQKTFDKRSSLVRHVDAMHKNIYKHVCETCGQKFKSKESFDKHVREHMGIKQAPKQCIECGAWLKNKHSLYLHRLRHDEKVDCNICGRTYPSRIALKHHQNYMHKIDKNLKCMYCEKQFKLRSSLEEHVARHTDSYLYNCDYCKKEFRSKANMYAHIKRQHVAEWVMTKRVRSNNPAFQKANDKTTMNVESNVAAESPTNEMQEQIKKID